ncbi:hypothetical protein R0K04_24270, partial [Pseudoalteromonas sp. SIMBA_153]
NAQDAAQIHIVSRQRPASGNPVGYIGAQPTGAEAVPATMQRRRNDGQIFVRYGNFETMKVCGGIWHLASITLGMAVFSLRSAQDRIACCP